MDSRYQQRVVDLNLKQALASSGAVLIEGPKASGKTRTALEVAATVFSLDRDNQARSAAEVAPQLLLDAAPPVLIDEWQIVPSIWNQVRHAVDDQSPTKGLFILTGSATPNDDVNRHSGAGRFAKIRMRPMSLFETGHSTGEVSLTRLFDGEIETATDPGLTIPGIIDRIVIGGWPALIEADPTEASRWVRSYLSDVVETDIHTLFERRRDPERVRRLLVSLARQTGTSASIASLTRDVSGDDGGSLRETITGYLDALGRLMLTEDVPAWGTHMRSKTPLTQTETRFLTDPSLAAAALQAGPGRLLKDLNATGFLFEALAVRDVRVYADPIDSRISHWRDKSGHEVDIIVEQPDGRWGAFEVKMNPGHADAAAKFLLRFRDKVNTKKAGSPSFLGVITTTGFAYRRPDGVQIVPIGTLGP